MKRQIVSMVDGRSYWSTDGWATVMRDGRDRPCAKREADLVRFLVAMGAN